ncbi:MAG: Nramp family divalent metal transporter [Bacteroidales bacterium]|nr:Nramp family divalent metal transporter [Bacteroidales bacterium]
MAKRNILKVIGPGLLWAGAAIGVSHIVQSTRAGANFGFELIWIIIIANILKYPFFEFAPRYAASTGETLIGGYKRLGKWAVYLYGLITILTMFFLMTAVTVVTAGIFANVFQSAIPVYLWAIIIISILALVVIIGKYSTIDKFVKVIIVLLALATIIAVISAFSGGFNPNLNYVKDFNFKSIVDISFLLALVGWMPTAIDVSVWHSVWTITKKKETGYSPKLKESLLDFNIGYIGTAVLSLGFLSLGALVMYGSGEKFSESGVTFAGQLISLFTSSLGPWAYLIIVVAAIATMVSTTVTCLDAYPRVLEPVTKIVFQKLNLEENTKKIQNIWLLVVVTGSVIIFLFFLGSMKTMVDIATIIAFITAPVLGWLNLKVITLKHIPENAKPGKFLIILSWVGLVFLSTFGIYFLLIRFIL